MSGDHFSCNQEDNIKEIKSSLRDLIQEFRGEFRSVMAGVKTALEDGREYRIRIEANEKRIEDLKETTDHQWKRITENRDKLDAIDKNKAEASDVKELQQWKASTEGGRKTLLYLPTAITFLLTVIVLWEKITS